MTIEVPDREKYYYRNKERFQKELNGKKKIIDQLSKGTQTLFKENSELEKKSQEQGRKIIEQQKDLHEKEINQKKNEQEIENLEEQIGDLQPEKEAEEYKLSLLTEQMERG